MKKSENQLKRKFYTKKRYLLPVVIILILIGLRMYLPYWVKNHINKALADIPGYYGYVDDVDIALIKGAYILKGMYLNKVNAGTKTPYLDFPKSDISIEWSALLKGKIVSEVVMINPKVTYILEVQEKNVGKEAKLENWTKALTKIVPFKINNFTVHNGSAAFVQFITNPDIDLHINKIELSASNLRNVEQKKRILPSSIKATGVSIGNGVFKMDGKVNLVKEIPDLNLNISLQNVNAVALNTASKYYAGLQFESGEFDLFSEIAISDGYLKGYIKPMLKHSKFTAKGEPILSKVWEGIAAFFKFILKNHRTDTLATKAVLEGNLNSVSTDRWKVFVGILKNGWIKALTDKTDNSIQFQDAFNQDNKTIGEEATKEGSLSKDNADSKREIRKEARKEKRKIRREKKEELKENKKDGN